MRSSSWKRALSMLLCLCMTFTALSGAITFVTAAGDGSGKTDGTGGHVADVGTMDTFEAALGLFENSRYAGRVWSDKSAFTAGVSVNGTTIENDSDFLHVFSALGSSLKMSSATQLPLDVVFILDTSFSMVSSSDTYGGTNKNSPTKNRLSVAANALDEAMALVMNANPKNRVGLVEFSSNAYEVMNLGRYTPDGNNNYFTYTPLGGSATSATIGRIVINASVEANSGGAIESKRSANLRYAPILGTPRTDTIDDARLTPLRPDTTLGFGTNYAYGMTNTQAGLYTGMNMLATADLGTGEEQRLPIVVLITDGQPTRSLAKGSNNTTSSWWDPAGEITHGQEGLTSSKSYAGHGLQALATASYMKAKINERYFGENRFGGNTAVNSSYKAHVFTFGLETGVLKDDDKDLALSVMEPGAGLKESNDMADGINGGWSRLCGGADFTFADGAGNITMQRWTSGSDGAYNYLIKKTNAAEALNYVDEYVPVDNADSLPDELSRVLSFTVESAPWVPVAGGNDVQATGGNTLTYIDPIGKYMEVKSVKNLLLFGQLYSLTSAGKTTTNGITTETYTISPTGAQGTLAENRWNPAYGDVPDDLGTLPANTPGVYKLSDIKISVQTSGDIEDPNVGGGNIESDTGFDQALYIDIPANALPLWVVSVEEKGKTSTYTTNRDAGNDLNNASPLRVFYTVGMATEVLTDGKVDLTLVDEEYLADNKGPDNATYYFYSNWYKDDPYDYILTKDYTYGDPVMSFSPAANNRYYVFQKNLTVYTENADGTGSNTPGTEGRAAADLYPAASIESDKWYYIVLDYYTKDGSKGEYTQVTVPRIGSMFGSGIGSDEVEFASHLVYLDENGAEHPLEVATDGGIKTGSVPSGVTSNIYTKIGGVRTGNMSKNVAVKENSPIDPDNSGKKTAGTYYLPTISRSSGPSADSLIINNYMGNNARLSVTETQVLVTKTVQGSDPGTSDGEGGTKPTEFRFTIKLMKGTTPVYVNKTVGAIIVTRHSDASVNKWRARADKIELFTDSRGMLLDSGGKRAEYTDPSDNITYYIYVGGNDNTDGVYTYTVFDSNDGTVSLTDDDDAPITIETVHLVPVSEYDDGVDYGANPPNKTAENFRVGTIDWDAAIGHEIKLGYKGRTTYLRTDVEFDGNGEATFTLRHGEGLLFDKLDPDVTYTVKEILTKAQIDGDWEFVTVKSSGSGTVTKTDNEGASGDGKGYAVTGKTSVTLVTSEEHYFNRNIENSGGLKIEKTVVNVTGDTVSDSFTFVVTLTLPASYNDENDTGELPDRFAYIGYKIEGAQYGERVTAPDAGELIVSGWKKNADNRWCASGNVTLSHGQGVYITELPYGTDYEITETVSAGYVLKSSVGENGTIQASDTVPTAQFSNEALRSLPATGGSGAGRYMTLTGIMMLAAAIILLSKRTCRRAS